jgi:Leucine-rich repeat (LRR) protein
MSDENEVTTEDLEEGQPSDSARPAAAAAAAIRNVINYTATTAPAHATAIDANLNEAAVVSTEITQVLADDDAPIAAPVMSVLPSLMDDPSARVGNVRGPRPAAAAAAWRSIRALTVESDPVDLVADARKRDMYYKRLCTGLLAVGFLGMIILAVMLGVCGTQGCSSSLSSKSQSQSDLVRAFIQNISLKDKITIGSDYFSDRGREDALKWLIENGTLNLLPNTPTNRFRLTQRYALATLNIPLTESDNGANECDWFFVTCEMIDLGLDIGEQSTVTEINLAANQFGNEWSARLSPDLGLLSSMVHFKFVGPNLGYIVGLQGSLPTEIGLWTNLETFNVSSCDVTGELPSEIGLWTHLTISDMSNTSVRSTLPSDIGQWRRLLVFNMSAGGYGSTLQGTLPSEIGQWTSLIAFNVNGQPLTGSLPTWIGQWSNLTTFMAALGYSSGGLTSSLPSEIGQWTSLITFNVNGQSLRGSLPTWIGQWSNLTTFLAKSDPYPSNGLTGSFPSEIGQWVKLVTFDVSGNDFNGTLPTWMGQWTSLKELDVSNTLLMGTAPNSTCLLNLSRFYVCGTEVKCRCCTTCN